MAKFVFVKVQAQPKVQALPQVRLGRFDCAAQLKPLNNHLKPSQRSSNTLSRHLTDKDGQHTDHRTRPANNKKTQNVPFGKVWVGLR